MIKKLALLLTPAERCFYMNFLMPPLAIGVINGYLRDAGFEVDVYDLNVILKNKSLATNRNDWLFLYDKDIVMNYLNNGAGREYETLFSKLVEDIDFEHIDLLGISLGSNFSFFEIHSAFMIARYIKQKYNIPIVFGGDNVQYLYQFRYMFKDLWKQFRVNFEYIFVGPGERSLAALVGILNREVTHQSYTDLPGAIYFTENGLTANPHDEPTLHKPNFAGLDPDAYKLCLYKNHPNAQGLNETFFYKWPFPHALLVSDGNRARLKPPEREETLFIPYIFNYNCPFRCAFCTQSSEKKKRVIAKDAQSVVNDLEALMKEYNTRFFYFFNNAFNFKTAFVHDFCRIVKEKDLKFYWCDCARFNGLDKDLLRMMHEAGCRKLVFGFETGSEKILKLIDKRLDLDHARQVLRWCKELNIWADLEVILGLPHELEEDFRDTYNFIKENIELINGLTINKYFVVPESLMGSYPEKYGMKLIKLSQKYEKKLKMNAQLFLKAVDAADDNVSATNFQLYHYEEIDGRDFMQIIKETQDKTMRLCKLYAQTETFRDTQINRMVSRKSKNNKNSADTPVTPEKKTGSQESGVK